MDINHNQVVDIPKGEHDDPHELPQQQELEGSTKIVHNPISRNCAIIHVIQPYNHNSTELHQQGVAPRSQYSDHMPEVITLQ